MDEIEKEGQTPAEDASSSEESEHTNEVVESEKTGVETVESEETPPAEVEVDYEAELEKERQRLGKKIDKEREKRIEAERNQGIPREEIERLVDERVGGIEKRLFRSTAEASASRLAKTPAERDLILHHYDHSIVSTGNLEQDMEHAYALANVKRMSGTISELKRGVQSKQTRGGASDAGRPVEIKKPVKYSKDDIDGAKFAGVSVEEFVKNKS